MKRLSILRHAKAEPHDATGSDFDRALAERGRNDVATFCRWASDRLKPGVALISPALRTRQTFDLLQAGLGREISARYVPEIYMAEIGDLLEVLRATGDAEEALLVGHNPGLEDLAVKLLGEETELKTCGFVAIDLPIDDWSELDRHVRGKLAESYER